MTDKQIMALARAIMIAALSSLMLLSLIGLFVIARLVL